MRLASSFAAGAPVLRANQPLTDAQMRAVAPSIFSDGAHASRSPRYRHIATASVLDALRREGFAPFMVCQSRVRLDQRRAYTKHLVRLRHASQIHDREANEIILLNSHDGSSCYQMLGGMFCFVCENGLVCGDTVGEVRVPHKGDVADLVVAGAYQVLDGFAQARVSRDAMRAVTLDAGEASVFAEAALALKYDAGRTAPIRAEQLLTAERAEDSGSDLWSVFNRTQEHLIKGGLRGRSSSGRRLTTRPVQGIDQDLRLNRALWLLADGMRQLKG